MTRRSRQCLRPRNRKRVRFVGRSQEREGKKAKETRDEIWDEKFGGAQEEKDRDRDRDRALQFGRLSWFLFFFILPSLPWTALTYLLTMETRRESPVFSFFLFFSFFNI